MKEKRPFIHSILSERKSSLKTAVVCPEVDVELTYAELYQKCTRLASLWERKGAEPGARVAILLPNSPELVIALFATLQVGWIAVPLDIYAKKPDILSILEVIETNVVITNQNLLRKVKSDIPQHIDIHLLNYAGMNLTIETGSVTPSGTHFTDVSARLRDPGPAALPDIKPDTDALFVMTSGTIGRPKAVRLSHQALLHNIRMHLETLEIDSELMGLQALPMNYSYGLIASFLSILSHHGTAVLVSRFIESETIHYIDEYKVNLFMGTPAMFRFVMDRPKNIRKMRRLKHITLGGSNCRPYLAQLIREHLPETKAYITYGLSEAGPRVTTLPPQYFATMANCVGRPLNGVDLSIINEKGEELAPYKTGEVLVKTPSIMSGYFKDPVETDKVIRNGWCHTGDLGHKDENGFLYIEGRKNREFKVNSKKVNPAFIEGCICSHPMVKESQVSKVEHDNEEYIRAIVKVRNNFRGDLCRELKKLCHKQMPFFMVPREFIMDTTDTYQLKEKHNA